MSPIEAFEGIVAVTLAFPWLLAPGKELRPVVVKCTAERRLREVRVNGVVLGESVKAGPLLRKSAEVFTPSKMLLAAGMRDVGSWVVLLSGVKLAEPMLVENGST